MILLSTIMYWLILACLLSRSAGLSLEVLGVLLKVQATRGSESKLCSPLPQPLERAYLIRGCTSIEFKV